MRVLRESKVPPESEALQASKASKGPRVNRGPRANKVLLVSKGQQASEGFRRKLQRWMRKCSWVSWNYLDWGWARR